MDAPYRWRVADNQTQRTLGGNIMELHETGPYVLWNDYVRLQYKSQCQTEGIDAFDKKLREAEAEVERLEHQVNYWRIEAETDNARWLRCLENKERLTKAGDNLEQVLTEISYSYRAGNASHEWRSAKGVQS
jgi:hypothetical protein